MLGYNVDINELIYNDIINKDRCTYLLNKIFNDAEINDRIKALKNEKKIPENINSLEEVQNEIKETTVYLGLIHRLNKYINDINKEEDPYKGVWCN